MDIFAIFVPVLQAVRVFVSDISDVRRLFPPLDNEGHCMGTDSHHTNLKVCLLIVNLPCSNQNITAVDP